MVLPPFYSRTSTLRRNSLQLPRKYSSLFVCDRLRLTKASWHRWHKKIMERPAIKKCWEERARVAAQK